MKKRRLNHLGKVIITDNETVNPEVLLISITTAQTGCDKKLSKLLQLIFIDLKYALLHGDKQDYSSYSGKLKVTHLSSWESWKPWLSLGPEESRLTLKENPSAKMTSFSTGHFFGIALPPPTANER